MKTFYIVLVSTVVILIIIEFIVLMLMVSTNIFSSKPVPIPPKPNPSPIPVPNPSPIPVPNPSPIPVPNPSPIPVPNPSPPIPGNIIPKSVFFDIEELDVPSVQSKEGVFILNKNSDEKELQINFSKPIDSVNVSFDISSTDQINRIVLIQPDNKLIDIKLQDLTTVNEPNVSFKTPINSKFDRLRIFIKPNQSIIFSNLLITQIFF